MPGSWAYAAVVVLIAGQVGSSNDAGQEAYVYPCARARHPIRVDGVLSVEIQAECEVSE